MPQRPDSYHQPVYLEFRDSNWHAYWDKPASHIKPKEIFQFWYIKNDELVGHYSYKALLESLKDDRLQTELEVFGSISHADYKILKLACLEFIADVNAKYDT